MDYKKRIFISPMSRNFSLATHILTRLQIENKFNKRLIYDNEFSFQTSAHLSRRTLSYNKIVIGICLSVSKENTLFTHVIDSLVSLDIVKFVYLVGYDTKLVNSKLEVIDYRTDLWRYLDNINLFITGDGLMAYESFYQSIPTIIYSNKKSKIGSNKFEDNIFRVNDLNDLLKIVTEIDIEYIHQKIKKIKLNPFKLAKTIYKIISNNEE